MAGLAGALCSSTSGFGKRAPAVRYTYHRCAVYTTHDWFNTDLVAGGSRYVPNTVDANSARIIRNLTDAFGEIDFSRDTPSDGEGVNIVNSHNVLATPKIENLTYGFANNTYNDDPAPHTIKISRGRFMQEGTRYCTQQGQDCHVNVLDSDRCVEYETYRSGSVSWDGRRYVAEGGGVENLNHPYQIEHIIVTAAHLPMMGTTDWGEDVTYQQPSCQPRCAIPHILAFFLPQPGVATKGYVNPAAGEAFPCTSGRYCNAYTLPYGARLRLNSTYPCPDFRTYPQANLLCNQAKQYGWIFNDTTGVDRMGGVRFGLTSDAQDPWRHADLNAFLSKVRLSDFEVMQLGTVR